MFDVLEQLRDRCLCYAAGYVPSNRKSRTISHSLWKQSPFAAIDGQIDLAASGFSLAALPVAVERGLLTWENGCAIATDAAARVREMVRLSARAETEKAIAKYGCDGMLYHFYRWDYGRREFVATRAVDRGVNEVSSIDTALLMWGLLTCGSYFGGGVAEDYAVARDRISWNSWFDAGRCQFRRAYYPDCGFEGWWDWYTQEAMLISLLAAMSDPRIDAAAAWRGWTRELRTYTSPSPEGRTFQCYATWNGDPFTVAYGMAFLDLAGFSRDLDGRWRWWTRRIPGIRLRATGLWGRIYRSWLWRSRIASRGGFMISS